MKILLTASECSPFAKVGGIGDVIQGLAISLNQLGVKTTIAIPFYNTAYIKKTHPTLLYKNLPILFEGQKRTFNVFQAFLPKTKTAVLLIDKKDYFFTKEIYISKDASSEGGRTEAKRFLFLSKASIKIAETMNFDIIHCNDWHTALIPFLIKQENKKIKTVLTIHNLGYQGIYPKKLINSLLKTNFSQEVNSLKIGIQNADFITTVSPSYAKEILTPEYGYGLEKDLFRRKKELAGIVNGIDYEVFNPEKDKFIAKNYSIKNLGEKERNKSQLQKKHFHEISDKPILSLISRLASQKGIDLIIKILPQLMEKDIQFIILGKGLRKYEDFFIKANKKFPNKFVAKIEFSEKLAHQIYAGADIFLMPSLYEPCGLGQEIAMRYGTIPIVRSTGGLKDTVEPIKINNGQICGTGFLFEKYSPQALLNKIAKALEIYKQKKTWEQIQINGMKKDFSWEKSAILYKKIYQKLFLN